MKVDGVVRWFDVDQGWGVIDSDATPGGAAVIFSSIQSEGFRQLTAGQTVTFVPLDVRPGHQDGYGWRAENVTPGPLADGSPAPEAGPTELTVTLAERGEGIWVEAVPAKRPLAVVPSAILQACIASVALALLVLLAWLGWNALDYLNVVGGTDEPEDGTLVLFTILFVVGTFYAVASALYIGAVTGTAVGLVIKRMRRRRSLTAVRWAAGGTCAIAVVVAFAINPLVWPMAQFAIFVAVFAPFIAAWRASDIARPDRG